MHPGLVFLLGLAEKETRRRAAERLNIKLVAPMVFDRPQGIHLLIGTYAPSSQLLWMLEEDDPQINRAVFTAGATPAGIRRAILRGVPFGPTDKGRITVDKDLLRYQGDQVDGRTTLDHAALAQALRQVYTLGLAKRASGYVVTRDDWALVSAADRERPLPGYTRWALSIRIDCPPELRAQFGSHRKFTHRLRQAGIVSGPREYVEQYRSARHVLEVLAGQGRTLFPRRLAEAEDVLRPLVRREMGTGTESWAVLAQLLPTFSGTVPELVRTAGAVAHGSA